MLASIVIPGQPFPVLFGGVAGASTALTATVETVTSGATDYTGIALVLGAVASILSALAGLIIALRKKPDGITAEELAELLKRKDPPS